MKPSLPTVDTPLACRCGTGLGCEAHGPQPREHAVACVRCQRPTWQHSAVCCLPGPLVADGAVVGDTLAVGWTCCGILHAPELIFCSRCRAERPWDIAVDVARGRVADHQERAGRSGSKGRANR